MSRRWLLLILLVWGGVFPHTASSQPRRVVRSVERAVMAINAKQYAKAEKILRQVVQRYPDYFEARYELALALSLQGRYDEALAECIVICDTAVPRDKQRDHYFQLLGNLYAQKDDSTNADHAYQLGLRRFPTSARLHVEVAIRHAMRGDVEEALESIENAISGDPTYPLSYYWGARFYRASTERIWAFFYAEIFLNLRPNSPKADEISTLWYNMFRETVEQFDEEGRIVLSREIRGSVDLSNPTRTFQEVFTETLQQSISILRFNRDFELPIASIDTLLRQFLALWKRQGYDTTYRNIIIERYMQLERIGLLEPYIYVLAQFGKPMQFEIYAKKHKQLLHRLERWIQQNRLVLTRNNYISRYR